MTKNELQDRIEELEELRQEFVMNESWRPPPQYWSEVIEAEAEAERLYMDTLDGKELASLYAIKALLEKTEHSFEVFYDAYMECAMWAEDDESEEWDDAEIAESFIESARIDCARFYNAHLLELCFTDRQLAQAGYDFLLTRNGHGSGFWDRETGVYGDLNAEKLTDASHAFPTISLYKGDDGFIYGD
jgi:hypothetical protein